MKTVFHSVIIVEGVSTMQKLHVDMWYGDAKESADKIDITFYPNAGEYRGNIYRDGKIIGDYVCGDSLSLEKLFPQLTFRW